MNKTMAQQGRTREMDYWSLGGEHCVDFEADSRNPIDKRSSSHHREQSNQA